MRNASFRLRRSWGAVILPLLLLTTTVAALDGFEDGPIGRHLLQQNPKAAVARIFRGDSVPTGEKYPFIVSLRKISDGGHFCGGCLVAPDLVLTAAHCVDENGRTLGIPNPKVLIGAVNVEGNAFAEEREVCNTIIHSKWEGDARFGFDIALLELKEPSNKRAVSISTLSQLPLGDRLSALGWGRTSTGLAATLQEVLTLEETGQSACNAAWAHEPISIIASMVCADGPAGGDTCKGDSGGPLLQNGELVGITSFGPRQCGIAGTPGVYTRVASFAAWIESRGAGQSKRKPVPFCGAKAAKPVSQKDKLSALMSDGDTKEAAALLGSLIASGDSGTVVESVVEVSINGRAQFAVNAILQAAKDGVSEDALIAALNAATKQLPDKNKPISSGVAEGRSVSNAILPLMQAGDVDGAAEQVVIAMEAKDSESVLQAMSKSIADENRSTVSAVLVAAIKDYDADPAELAAILSPLCKDDDACSSFLLELANS